MLLRFATGGRQSAALFCTVLFASICIAAPFACRKPGSPSDTPGSASSTATAQSSGLGAATKPTLRDAEGTTTQGVGDQIDAWSWFAQRGVKRAALLVWYRRQFKACRPELAANLLDASHYALRVGAPPEDAIYGEHGDACEAELTRGWVAVVRAGNPTVVLDAPLLLTSYDDNSRWLDLALVIAPDGLSAVLRDRAPEGALLLEPASWVSRRDARAAACEAKIAAGQPVETTTINNTDTGEPWCPLVTGADGGQHVDREVYVKSDQQRGGYPKTLHDCANATAQAREWLGHASPPERAIAKLRSSAIDAACAKRGRWVFERGHFVREAKP